MARKVQFLPKITAALITAAHFGKPLPHSAKVIGKVAKMQQRDGNVTFQDGRKADAYFLLLGSFALLVGEELEFRSSQAILPDCFVSQLALEMAGGATVIEFAIELSQIQHPTKPNLSMWTFQPLIKSEQSDPLAELLRIAESPKQQQLPATGSKKARA